MYTIKIAIFLVLGKCCIALDVEINYAERYKFLITCYLEFVSSYLIHRKAGRRHGMSYTKKNVDTLSLLLTISILMIFYLIYSSISLAVISKNSLNSSMVYSTKIPIKNQTQRQIVQANLLNQWRIQIPKLNLDAHIEEGITSDVLLSAVGHFEDTSRWSGNVCLAGHNRGYQCNFFQKIKSLKIGDEIIYCTKQGKKVYQVQTNKVILETDWSYIENTKDDRITLITCEENREEYRRCIQAVKVSEIENIF